MKYKRKRGCGYDPHAHDEIIREVQITEFVDQ